MKIRIVSIPHWLHGRAYRPEIEVTFKFLFWTWKRWERLPGYSPECETEEEAKRRAEEYAKGSWVSYTANFKDPS
jgi:hypothetical protein